MNSGDIKDRAKFDAAITRFDEENARDPNREAADGATAPRELIYARWLTDWVLKLRPDASEALRLAARCQHLRRWEIARASYPMDRPGYLRWRADLKKFHAEKAGEILREVGYDEPAVRRVVHRLGEELVAVPPAVLDVVHRDVRVLHQHVGVAAVVGVERDASARREVELAALDEVR